MSAPVPVPMAGADAPRRLNRAGLCVALAVLAADQASKWLMLGAVMVPPRVVEVTPFFNLVLVWNKGVSFGLFPQGTAGGRWALIGLSLLFVAVLAAWLRRPGGARVAWGLGGVIGGALGNVADRLIHGAVVDFLDFHIAGWHWPAFNLADSAIVVGAGLLLLDALFGRGK